MGAAFVDIGLGRNAFLYVDDINKQPLNIGDVEITQGHSGFTISEKVKRGDDVLVQIVKEPRGLKGARISTNISLPGRYLILMPTGKYSGVSRKIDSADERNRLKLVMKRIRPEGMATVVRTAAAGASEAELIADLGVLIRMWHGILETYKRAPSASLLHKDMNLVYKAARDFITPDVDRVLIDDEEEYRKIRDFLQLLGPQYIGRLEYYNSGRSLFDDYKIDDELQKLMKPKINLPSGASIVIESTEALTVIDVNSGKFTGGRNLEDTILKTNIEAAEEIARQVRLRDIGGIIVVDFIDMASEASRDKVVKTMEESLRRDRTRATIQSFSNLGLLEFTRKRIGRDLGSQLRGACPTCAGMGSVMSAQSVAIETFRRIRSEAGNGAAGDVVVHVAPTVAVQMDYWYEEECEALARSIERPIHVRVDPMIHPEKARVEIVAAYQGRQNTRGPRRRRTRGRTPAGAPPEPDVGRGGRGRPPRRSGKRGEQRRQLRAPSHHRRRRRKRLHPRRARHRRREDAAQTARPTPGNLGRRADAPAPRACRRRGAAVRLAAADRHLGDHRGGRVAGQGAACRTQRRSAARRHHHRARRRAARRKRRPAEAPPARASRSWTRGSRCSGRIGATRRSGASARNDCSRGTRRRRRIGRRTTSATSAATARTARPRRRRGFRRNDARSPDLRSLARRRGASDWRNRASRTVASNCKGRRSPPPAVEAPPPSLSVPAEDPMRTKPARRRRTPRADVTGELEGSASALALPAPVSKTRRPRKPAAGTAEPAAPEVQAKPKVARKRKAATAATSRKKPSPNG